MYVDPSESGTLPQECVTAAYHPVRRAVAADSRRDIHAPLHQPIFFVYLCQSSCYDVEARSQRRSRKSAARPQRSFALVDFIIDLTNTSVRSALLMQCSTMCAHRSVLSSSVGSQPDLSCASSGPADSLNPSRCMATISSRLPEAIQSLESSL